MKIEELYKLYVSILGDTLHLVEEMDSPHELPARAQHVLFGSLKFADAFCIARVLMEKKPRSLLEVGSFIGLSTRWQCEILQRTHRDGENWRLTAVDPDMRHRVFDNPRTFVEALNKAFIPEYLEVVTAFFGDLPYSMYWYECEEANPKLDRETVDGLLSGRPRITGQWGRTFDCIFIDANHSYESVHENFAHALPLLNPAGTILFHDALTWESVNKALLEIREQWQGKASLEILDSSAVLEHPALNKIVGVAACDGIGVFTLLP